MSMVGTPLPNQDKWRLDEQETFANLLVPKTEFKRNLTK
jgi:hypothetical protein